jgi:hypothetical protein
MIFPRGFLVGHLKSFIKFQQHNNFPVFGSAFCLQMIYLVLVQKGLATHVISIQFTAFIAVYSGLLWSHGMVSMCDQNQHR